jgi:hypothetical protein
MSNEFASAQVRREWTKPVPQMERVFWPQLAAGSSKDQHEALEKVFALLGIERQASKLDLVLHLIVAKASDQDKTTIWCSMEHSNISSGDMVFDKNDTRGYYQDKIIVEMWLTDLQGKPSTQFRRIADGPDTVNGSGSTTSSVSFSFSESGSANVGFFGGTPTGSVGGSVSAGVTQSHSFSKSLQDFRAINDSDQYRAIHTYKMQQSSGAKYNKATDLVPHPDDMGFTDSFEGIRLYNPPDLATSNFPLISQCVWQSNDSQPVDQDMWLKLRVTQRVVLVEGSNEFFSVSWDSSGYTLSYGYSEKLPMSDIHAPAIPTSFGG